MMQQAIRFTMKRAPCGARSSSRGSFAKRTWLARGVNDFSPGTPDDGIEDDICGVDSFVTPVAIDKHRILLIEDIFKDEIDESYVRLFDTRTRTLSDEAWRSLNQPKEYYGCVVCNGKSWKSIRYRRTKQ
jgi:hypothetical protein